MNPYWAFSGHGSVRTPARRMTEQQKQRWPICLCREPHHGGRLTTGAYRVAHPGWKRDSHRPRRNIDDEAMLFPRSAGADQSQYFDGVDRSI